MIGKKQYKSKDKMFEEKDIDGLGFQLAKSYDHDQFHTNRYVNGPLEVEFSYEQEKLVHVDLTITEINCMEVNLDQLQMIVVALSPQSIESAKLQIY